MPLKRIIMNSKIDSCHVVPFTFYRGCAWPSKLYLLVLVYLSSHRSALISTPWDYREEQLLRWIKQHISCPRSHISGQSSKKHSRMRKGGADLSWHYEFCSSDSEVEKCSFRRREMSSCQYQAGCIEASCHALLHEDNKAVNLSYPTIWSSCLHHWRPSEAWYARSWM